MNIQELRERRQNSNDIESLLSELSKPPEFKKPPENEWSPDFNHIKISHYEHGIGADYECVELLNRIKEKDAELLVGIEYIHNHKGGIFIFLNWEMHPKYAFNIYKIGSLHFPVECIYPHETDNIHKEPVVENLIRHIRTEAEWVSKYSHRKDLMKIYFKKIMAHSKQEVEFLSTIDYITKNNLTVTVNSLSAKARIYSLLLELEIKIIPEHKWGKINLYNKEVMSIICKTKI
jgi:hypothetical protein